MLVSTFYLSLEPIMKSLDQQPLNVFRLRAESLVQKHCIIWSDVWIFKCDSFNYICSSWSKSNESCQDTFLPCLLLPPPQIALHTFFFPDFSSFCGNEKVVLNRRYVFYTDSAILNTVDFSVTSWLLSLHFLSWMIFLD